jgi:hypothetical protein
VLLADSSAGPPGGRRAARGRHVVATA